jgi:Holliday junction resolvase RusA-like endonuclease
VEVIQVCRKPKTTTRSWPRGDVDNFAKAVLDAITRSDWGWDDDDQILELKIIKRFAEADEQPRSDIRWKPVTS